MVRLVLPRSIWPLAFVVLAGCAKPGSEHLSFDEAKDPKKRAKILFERRCPHIQKPTKAELQEYEFELNRLNPSPFISGWTGANFVPPPCPVRIKRCPDIGILKCPDSGLTETKKPKTHQRRIRRPRVRPDTGPGGVIIKP